MKLLRKKSAKAGKNVMNKTVATDDAIQSVVQEPVKDYRGKPEKNHRGVVEGQSTAKEEPSKASKKKKFGFISKSKRKASKKQPNSSTPQKNATTYYDNSFDIENPLTPETLIEVGNDNSSGEDDVHNISSDHVVSIVSVARQVSPPGNLPVRTEEELNETLTWGRSLLVELDMADAGAGSDGEAEGLELILPGTTYEASNDESVDEKDKSEDTVVKDDQPAIEEKTVETEENNDQNESEGITETDEKKPAEEDNEDATGGDDEKLTMDEEDNKTEENNAVVVDVDVEEKEDDGVVVVDEEKKDKEVDPLNSSVEFLEGIEGDSQQQPQQPQNAVTKVAVKVLTAAFACTGVGVGEDAKKYGEQIGVVYQNAMGRSRDSIDLDEMFDEKAGLEFLDVMLNFGYTLVYHIAVDEDSWVGRTVTMKFRPGVCNAKTIVEPVVEWKTMTGGKSTFVEAKSLNLLNIDAVTTSNAREAGDDKESVLPAAFPVPSKPPTNIMNDVSIGMCSLSFPPRMDEDEFDCFFTVTSQDGKVHLFEALNPEDCLRIVAGIRYSAQRLSRLLIEGDETALLSDFYDNSREPVESRLPPNEVMNRLSNAFMDGL